MAHVGQELRLDPAGFFRLVFGFFKVDNHGFKIFFGLGEIFCPHPHHFFKAGTVFFQLFIPGLNF